MSLFVARQPILDRRSHTIGYELLFRAGFENSFGDSDPDSASRKVLHDSLLEFGFSALVGSRKAYVNVTRRVLVEELYAVLPPKRVVVELLESVEPDTEVVEACRNLKTAGYDLALDDFVYSPEYVPLLELADIVKVDFLLTGPDERRSMVEQLSPFHVSLLAEKVESATEKKEALDLGYDYFQGYFFFRPEMMARKEVPAFKLNYLRFVREINRPELDFDELGNVIKQELSLSVKLLRYVNSAAAGLRYEVRNMKQALVMVGERLIRKWASVIALAEIGDDKPAELVLTGLLRARLCETIGAHARFDGEEPDLFLLGLLSVVEALVGRPAEEILAELPLAADMQAALLGEPNPLGDLLSLIVAYERGDWDAVAELIPVVGVTSEQLTTAYRDALEWTQEVFRARARSERAPVRQPAR